MTREGGRRRSGPDDPEEGGPDPTKDPILYLRELKEEE